MVHLYQSGDGHGGSTGRPTRGIIVSHEINFTILTITLTLTHFITRHPPRRRTKRRREGSAQPPPQVQPTTSRRQGGVILEKDDNSTPMIVRSWLCIGALLTPCTMAFAGWGPGGGGRWSRSTSTSHARLGKATAASSSAPSSSTSLQATVNGDSSSPAATAPAITSNDDMENITTKDLLSLQSIRNSLIRQEETIIFALIERAQYRHNAIVYEHGGFGNLGTPSWSTPLEHEEEGALSFLEYMLVGTEALHCGVRRYTSPEEHAFFPERLPKQGQMDALPQLHYPQDLLSNEGGASAVNFNKILLKTYIDTVVPSLTKSGDDEQHGSTVLADIAVLQALSRRIHYGKFVAESK